ncbi:hypothetical protein HU200_018341 [Digitaria exilis]|uniref:Glycosyltransferase n=1 Tax=Digitaria exilis TaxID=1010633 RepID=A0A835KFD0_9POAL|nr:hypothetical protein HU200_018341 [Digitaria exilis]CAB3500457.1 unnamed protein product [Digitaria exilis]
MASSAQSKKLRILLMPFFASSHMGPFTNFAVHLAAARPDVVEATVAVTTANAPFVRSIIARQSPSHVKVEVATYPFPVVDGLPAGVENLTVVKPADAWRIAAAAVDEAVMRPVQECLIRELSPDAVISDMHFFWNTDIAGDLGAQCLVFNVIGAFPSMAIAHLNSSLAAAASDGTRDVDTTRSSEAGVVPVPLLDGKDMLIPHTELPEFMRVKEAFDASVMDRIGSSTTRCASRAANTFLGLEQGYCELFAGTVQTRPSYFVGPVSLPPAGAAPAAIGGGGAAAGRSPCIGWLDRMPSQSVVFVCFGSLAPVSDAQLVELALGLEASTKPFLWVVRNDTWSPPEGWTERVGERGMLVKGWAPQTEILGHEAVGVFVTHCGWNSVMETVTAGVPVLTWPMVFEQFIIERLLTNILGIGERLFPEGAGVRSTNSEEHDLVTAETVAQAIIKFMEPGGGGDAARKRAKELSAEARAAMAEGGSSHRDLQRLIDDLMGARTEQRHATNILHA